MRLIITDTAEAARRIAGSLQDIPAREEAVNGLPVFASDWAATQTRVFGPGGVLSLPSGAPPKWAPVRKAAVKALSILARETDSLILSCANPLIAIQARDIVAAVRPEVLRFTRAGEPPFVRPVHFDEHPAEAAAAELEIDAVFADYLKDLDPQLRRQDLAALTIAGPNPVEHSVLIDAGVEESTITRLAERGYLVGSPAWWAPAASLIEAAVPGAVMDPATSNRCSLWIGAVARGTLSRADATARAMNLLEGMPRPVAPEGFDGGRLVGQCPECGDWMGGARERIRCLGCGHTYNLPRGTEVRAMPGVTCSDCGAPMIRPIVRGSVRQPRCPDAIGCPSNIGSSHAP